MTGIAARFDPYAHDPDRWGVSLAQSAELMLGCLDVAGVRSVVEIGAFAGDLTRVLVAWAGERGARVSAIDPSPQPELLALDEAHPQLRLIRATSLASLSSIPLPDAVVIDGDHNHYTVSEELRLLGDRVPGCDLPLLLFHDVCWPHGRRDDYYAPEQIPGDRRRPVAGDAGGLFPGEPGLRPRGGLPYPRSATREGGARNGVLTAVEDFVAGRDELRIAVVPAFFGLGVVWHREASWSEELDRLLRPWDGNPMLERLEANRVFHLAQAHSRLVELWAAQQRRERQEAVLRRLLESSAFALAERLSRLRLRAGVGPGHAAVSKAEVRRALDG